jgi:hypothetical protein
VCNTVSWRLLCKLHPRFLLDVCRWLEPARPSLLGNHWSGYPIVAIHLLVYGNIDSFRYFLSNAIAFWNPFNGSRNGKSKRRTHLQLWSTTLPDTCPCLLIMPKNDRWHSVSTPSTVFNGLSHGHILNSTFAATWSWSLFCVYHTKPRWCIVATIRPSSHLIANLLSIGIGLCSSLRTRRDRSFWLQTAIMVFSKMLWLGKNAQIALKYAVLGTWSGPIHFIAQAHSMHICEPPWCMETGSVRQNNTG